MTAVMVTGCGNSGKTETTAVQSTAGSTAAETTVAADNTKEGATVANTTYGPVKGIQEGEILTWYGIPYGKAPVGELRWKAPEAPDTWTEELDCTEESDQALQLSGTEVKGSEDLSKT